MSAIYSLSSSASVTYATQLAQASKLERSLNDLGTAIGKGDLTAAASTLTALIKAYPQYATNGVGTSTQQDPINQGFQAVASAIASGQADAAKGAWAQLKGALATAGVKDISDRSAATTQLLAENTASIDEALLNSVSGGASSGSPDAVTSAISNWLLYKAGGSTVPSTSGSTGTNLNAQA